MKSNKIIARELHQSSFEAQDRNPDNSFEPIKLLCQSLHYDPDCFGSLNDLAVRFAQLNLFEPAMNYVKRAVICEPSDKFAWKNFRDISNKFINSLESDSIKKEHTNKISKFIHDEFIIKRMNIPKIQNEDILIRVMNKPVYADNLSKKGEIRFVPTKEYRDSEDKARKDKNENRPISHIMVDEKIPLHLNHQVKEFKLDGGNVTFGHAGKGTILSSTYEVGGMESVACFTLITKDRADDFIANYDCEQFGDDAVVITDISQFNSRVANYLNMKGKNNILHGPITYMREEDLESWKGIFTPYLKTISYANELEYRFSYHNINLVPEIMRIGSIEDISLNLKTKDLKSWVQGKFSQS